MAERGNTNNAPILEEGVNAYLLEVDNLIIVDGTPGFTATGTDTYSITTGKSLTAYYTHQAFLVLFTNANTASGTLNVDSIGAKTLKKSGSTNLSSGDIAAGQTLLCVYDGTNFQVIGIGGSGGGSGTPAGSDTQVQFNDGGAFGGDAGLTYNKTTDRLSAGNVAVTDDPYDATGWNANADVPTKNALRDKIETLAPLASPALTGTPTAPTAALLTNTMQIANTAFVQQEINGTNSYIANKISLQLFNSY